MVAGLPQRRLLECAHRRYLKGRRLRLGDKANARRGVGARVRAEEQEAAELHYGRWIAGSGGGQLSPDEY